MNQETPCSRVWLFTLCTALLCSGTLRAEVWTNQDGRSLKAELVQANFEKDGVQVELEDGRKIVLKISTLSEDTQARLKEIVAEREAALATGQVMQRNPPNLDGFSYHYYLPASFKPDNRTPILILFSPGGNGKGILGHFKQDCEDAGWIVVGCNGLKNGMTWSDEEKQKVHDAMLKDIERTLPYHPYRMYLGGMSGGAMRSYGIAQDRPDLPLAGIIACGGWMGNVYTEKCATQMAVAVVNGDKDKAANAWMTPDREFLEKHKARVKHFAFEGGHVMPPKASIGEIFDWLESDWKATGMKEALKKMKRAGK